MTPIESAKLKAVLDIMVEAMMNGRYSDVQTLCSQMGEVGAILHQSALELYRARAGFGLILFPTGC